MKKIFSIVACITLAGNIVLAQDFSRLKNIGPGNSTSYAEGLYPVGNELYFAANNSTNGKELWKSDGTTAGTVMVADINPGINGSDPVGFVNDNGMIFFSAFTNAYGYELWKTDGTEDGTEMIKDLCPGGCGSEPMDIALYNGLIFFSAVTPTSGRELWVTDGTSAGTHMIKEIAAGTDGYVAKLATSNGWLFFVADDMSHGAELWKTDGTEAGTVMIKDIYPGSEGGNIEALTDINGLLYFIADDGVYGRELWRSDGTEDGTFMLKDVNPGYESADPDWWIEFDGTVLFVAQNGANGRQLWKTDGTTAGTIPVFDPGSDRRFDELVRVGNTVFFYGIDFAQPDGAELWKTDGTEAGTQLVKDINPGAGSSYPYNLKNVGGVLYFVANDGVHGYELWKSDGTEAGTTLVQDFDPGSEGSDPEYLTTTTSRLYMVATTDDDDEVWVSNFLLPLPLTLISFTGELSGYDASLQWKTTDEENVSRFILERSDDGISFDPISNIAALNTAGENTYDYTDHLGAAIDDQDVYYRLKMEDIDGSYKYSRVIRFSLDADDRVKMYPNPVRINENLHISCAQGITEWSVSTISGGIVKRSKANASQSLSISTSGLVKGVYILRVVTANEKSIVKKLVVQ